MTARPPILLIGLRASGKSTLGRRLGERLSLEFLDLDDVTPGLLGAATPAEALSTHGEPAFRDAEVRALRRSLGRTNIIIALGGGTPTAPGAADLIRASNARVIYLRAQPETLAARLKRTNLADRPSLTARGTLEEIADLFAARDPLYRTLADVIDTDDLDANSALELLGAALAD